MIRSFPRIRAPQPPRAMSSTWNCNGYCAGTIGTMQVSLISCRVPYRVFNFSPAWEVASGDT